MAVIHEIVQGWAKLNGPLYNSPKNQIRREIGPNVVIYVGDECGTVRDETGKYWDWFTTDEILSGNFRKINVHPAT